MSKLEATIEEFKEALEELEEVLAMEKNAVVRDSAIKRFELTFELSWKAAKAFLEDFRNVRCASPQTCFRELFNQGIIDYDETWIDMAKWRNAAVHTYKEELAEDLYAKLPRTLPYFRLLLNKLSESK
jgi:nucleotidyltransferase substrate binding protein (TIGR01987 family)